MAFAKVRDISAAVRERGGVLDRADHYVSRADLSALKARPVPTGSTVFAKIGEGLKLNRRALTAVPLVLDKNCMALTPTSGEVQPEYFFRFMQTVDLAPFAVVTSVPSVRRGDVGRITLPLPSLGAQAKIVKRLRDARASTAGMESETTRALGLLDHLEQKIFARAFRGELMPQDAAETPAAVMTASGETGPTPRPRRGRPRKVA